jgi:hypothetical protein
MDLQITGKVIQILEEQSGESRNGPWRKQEFVLETPGQYPKQVCIVQWGDNIDQFGIQEGETLTAHIDLQSREYNGRWYTDVKAWRVERPQPSAGGAPGGGPPPFADEPWPDEAPADGGTDDDLPF